MTEAVSMKKQTVAWLLRLVAELHYPEAERELERRRKEAGQ